MHVLITGGAGFIGSHIAEMHVLRGDKVHVVDNLSTGSYRNIEAFLNQPNFHFTEADLIDWEELNIAAAWADRIYHMAAVVGIYRVLEDPIKVLDTNVSSCDRLLRAIAAGGWQPQLIIASSSEVYGHSSADVLHESMDLQICSGAVSRWNYAVSKLMDESLGLSYARQYNIPVTLVRLFNTIGPRQRGRYGMVVPRFVRQAVTHQEITVYGNGRQTRAFCDVRDTVRALDNLAGRSNHRGQIINLGSDRAVSINQLAEMIKQRSKSCSVIRHIPYHKAYGENFDDIHTRCPDLGRLRKLTGFTHRYTLEQTLDDLILAAREAQKAA